MQFGLRARIVAVLACVSVLTLIVAAITLLSPLEQRPEEPRLILTVRGAGYRLADL